MTIDWLRIKGAVAGMLLGDGGLAKGKESKNAWMRIQHTEKQKDYLLHKAKILEELTSVRVTPIKPSGPRSPNWNYQAQTKCLPFYTRVREIAYPQGKKTVSRTWLNWLTPEGLALWYMDDGSLVKSRSFNKSGIRRICRRELYLHTCNFTHEECRLLATFIQERFGVKFMLKLHSSKTGYYNLKAGAKEANKFIEIVKPFIVPCMAYKVDMEYQLSDDGALVKSDDSV